MKDKDDNRWMKKNCTYWALIKNGFVFKEYEKPEICAYEDNSYVIRADREADLDKM